MFKAAENDILCKWQIACLYISPQTAEKKKEMEKGDHQPNRMREDCSTALDVIQTLISALGFLSR